MIETIRPQAQAETQTLADGRVKERLLQDIGIGIGKSVVFGIIFSAVGCLRGFQTGQGPIAVGVSATRAVVSSIFLIILADTVFAGASFLLN